MKITGGKYNSRIIKTFDGINIKPTLSKIRQAVFNTINAEGEYKTFADMYSGSGIMSAEALSRGFDVTSVEYDRKTARFIIMNFEKFDTVPDIHICNALKFLEKTTKTFDIIYLDPPYDSDLYDKSIEIISRRHLVNPSGLIIAEKPFSKIIQYFDFAFLKEKVYADKSIVFLKNQSVV